MNRARTMNGLPLDLTQEYDPNHAFKTGELRKTARTETRVFSNVPESDAEQPLSEYDELMKQVVADEAKILVEERVWDTNKSRWVLFVSAAYYFYTDTKKVGG